MGTDGRSRAGRALCLAALGLGLGQAAFAGDVVVTVPGGYVLPGRPTPVFVAVTRDGEVPVEPPRVAPSAGTLTPLPSERPGVWAWTLTPPSGTPIGPEGLRFEVTALGEVHDVAVPVALPEVSSLVVPARIEGTTRGGEVRFLVTGADLPPPEALQIVGGEGRVVGVEATEGGLEVRFLPEDIPFPRAVPIGVRDRRKDERPSWGSLRLKARPTIPLQSEPGSKVRLFVSGRPYGPFVADAAGNVSAWVDQYPGEMVAHTVVIDDLGNETQADLPLPTRTLPWLVPFVTGPVVPGSPPPVVWIHALQADGSPWSGDEPTCRTPAVDVPVRAVSPGSWMTVVPTAADGELDGARVECALGAATATAFRLPSAEGVPARLRMRVWPEDLRSDFPEAEVHVVVEDSLGERLPTDGVEVRAELGSVTLEPRDGTAARGTYDGTAAIGAMRDVVTATYVPAGVGLVADRVRLGWGDVPSAGQVRVHAQVVDPVRNPVAGVSVTLDAGAGEVAVPTTADGWASASVPMPLGTGAVVVRARVADRVEQMVVLRGERARGGPGTAELSEVKEVTIHPGRVAGISVSVEPSMLRAGPGSVAWIRVSLEDRVGSAVTDEKVSLEVSEGQVGPLRARSDGTFLAEYIPLPVERPRDVVVTARTDSLRSSAILHLEPRVVRVSVGPWAGIQTNFGAVTAPVVGADVDLRLRTRWLGEHGMIRAGVATYSFKATADAGIAGQSEIVATAFPVSAALMFREDVGPVGLWAGGGGAVAIYRMQLRFEDALISDATRAVFGPIVMAGIGRRALGGELHGTLRTTFLPTTGGEFGFSGNIGGVAVGAGYRVVF